MLIEKTATALPVPPTAVPHARKAFSLVSDIQLVLHTDIAEGFFKGSWQTKNIGLRQFAVITKALWRAARNDDPYAEWHLMKIYDRMLAVQEALKNFEQLCQEKITQKRGLEVVVFSNPKPLHIPLHFSTPFGYMAAQVLADLDYAMRQAYTLKKLGVLLEGEQLPAKLMRKLASFFGQGREWKSTGVTRNDIATNSAVAELAKQLMGQVPDVILKRKLRLGLLPTLSRSTVSAADNEDKPIRQRKTKQAPEQPEQKAKKKPPQKVKKEILKPSA